jgi:hypothetical protein
MQHHKNLLLWCCDGVQFAAIVFCLWQVYFGPPPDEPARTKMKRLALVAASVLLVSCIAEIVIRRAF